MIVAQLRARRPLPEACSARPPKIRPHLLRSLVRCSALRPSQPQTPQRNSPSKPRLFLVPLRLSPKHSRLPACLDLRPPRNPNPNSNRPGACSVPPPRTKLNQPHRAPAFLGLLLRPLLRLPLPVGCSEIQMRQARRTRGLPVVRVYSVAVSRTLRNQPAMSPEAVYSANPLNHGLVVFCEFARSVFSGRPLPPCSYTNPSF